MKLPLSRGAQGGYIVVMTFRIVPAASLVLTLTMAPALAGDSGGPSLMERGAEMFFKGLRQEIEPKLDELRGLAEKYGPAMTSFIEEMGPAFMEMVDEVRDWSRYSPPEMLPNGDIIIRRKPDPEGEKVVPQVDGDPKPGETDL